jgi:short subunit dehydrogenase-like uncharacterized protein
MRPSNGLLLRLTRRRHADEHAARIVICPGVGFDVIPTDCMAAMLKKALPDATHLVLVRSARTHAPRHRAHDDAISASREARQPGAPEGAA